MIEVKEVDATSGKVAKHFTLPSCRLRPLPNGNYLIMNTKTSVAELNANGKVIREIPVPYRGIDARLLRSGNLFHLHNRLREIDPSGRVVCETYLPGGADRFQECLPLVSLGFDAPRPIGMDLATDVAYHIKMLKKKDAILRSLMITDLEYMGSKAVPAIPQLIETLADVELCPRVASALLIRIGEPAIPLLWKATNDKRPGVRGWAIYTLANLERDQFWTLALVLAATRDPSPLVRCHAMDGISLSNLDNRRKIAILLPMLKDTGRVDAQCEDTVGVVAASILRSFPSESALISPFLIEVGRGSNPRMRIACINTLGFLKSGDENAARFIIEAYDVKDVADREAARQFRVDCLSALASITPESKKVLPLLINTLADRRKDWRLRQRVAVCLGNYGAAAKYAIPTLTEVIESSNDPVSNDARAALRKIQGP